MDKETLSHYGWIVILVLILAVMLALASPFGSFIAGAIKSTTAGLFNVNQTALGSAGIDVNDMVFENCDHLETEIRNATDTYTGDTCCKNCGKVLETGETVRPKIPEGGVYYVGVTNKYTSNSYDCTAKYESGDEFPETVNDGDVYVYGDYEYRYNQFHMFNVLYWGQNTTQGGWGVGVLNTSKTSYGEILTDINGYPVNTLEGTFSRSNKLTSSPVIPNTITNMSQTFYGCSSLATAPEIPNGVTDMWCAFKGCTSLTTVPVIPNSVTDMYSTFYGCTSLTDLSGFTIPSGVTNLSNTFSGCTSLTNINGLAIPNNVTSLSNTFQGCTSLTDLSGLVIPNNVTSLSGTFQGCTSLTVAPTIPNTTTGMYATFKGCTALEIAPEIPDSVSNMSHCFANCTSLTTMPDTFIIQKHYSVDYMFQNCTSLTGEIKTKLAFNYGNLIEGCFAGTTQPITLVSTYYYGNSRTQLLAETSTNGNITVIEAPQ